LKGGSPSHIHLVIEYRTARHHLFSLGYAFETNVRHHYSVAYRVDAFPVLPAELELKAQQNRFLTEAQSDFSMESLGRTDLGFHAQLKFHDLDYFSDLMPELVFPVEKDRGWRGSIGLFKRFKSTGRAEFSFTESNRKATYSQAFVDEVDGFVAPAESFHSLALDLAWDSFDHFVLPTQGVFLRFRGESYRDDQSHWRALLEYRHLIPLRGNHTLAFHSLVGGNDPQARLDQWFMVGGPEFFYGSEAMEFTVPNFMTMRLLYQAKIASVLGYDIMFGAGVDYGTDAFEFGDLWHEFETVGYGVSLKTYGNFRHLAITYGKNRDLGSSISILFGPKPFSLWRRN